MNLVHNPVARKMMMAVSGWMLTFFVVVHLIGNSSLFGGRNAINAYAAQLHNLGPLVWMFRSVMLVAVMIHVWLGILVTLENWAAKPQKYTRTNYLKADVASRTMIYSGLLVAGFVIFHLLHFTFRLIDPEVSHFADAAGRLDVYLMITLALYKGAYVGVYLVALVILFLHLRHGIGSSFQTLGLSSDRTMPLVEGLGKGVALVVFAGYAAIPILVFFGVVGF